MSTTGRPPSALTGALPVRDAIRDSEPLARLAERLRESRARHRSVLAVLPPPLAALVQPGPIDDAVWTLLVPHGAAAAKLRQCLPLLEQRLLADGHAPRALKVKVLRAMTVVKPA